MIRACNLIIPAANFWSGRLPLRRSVHRRYFAGGTKMLSLAHLFSRRLVKPLAVTLALFSFLFLVQLVPARARE